MNEVDLNSQNLSKYTLNAVETLLNKLDRYLESFDNTATSRADIYASDAYQAMLSDWQQIKTHLPFMYQTDPVLEQQNPNLVGQDQSDEISVSKIHRHFLSIDRLILEDEYGSRHVFVNQEKIMYTILAYMMMYDKKIYDHYRDYRNDTDSPSKSYHSFDALVDHKAIRACMKLLSDIESALKVSSVNAELTSDHVSYQAYLSLSGENPKLELKKTIHISSYDDFDKILEGEICSFVHVSLKQCDHFQVFTQINRLICFDEKVAESLQKSGLVSKDFKSMVDDALKKPFGFDTLQRIKYLLSVIYAMLRSSFDRVVKLTGLSMYQPVSGVEPNNHDEHEHLARCNFFQPLREKMAKFSLRH